MSIHRNLPLDMEQFGKCLMLRLDRTFVRPVILQGAPHFWAADPIEEAGSFSGFLAPRLIRFLQARL
jgi:hypothetical protein